MWSLLAVLTCAFVCGVRGNSQFENELALPSQFGVQLTQESGSPWPMPQSMVTTGEMMSLADRASFKISQGTAQNCPVLDRAISRYYNIIFTQTPDRRWVGHQRLNEAGVKSPESLLTGLVVNISDCSELYPSLASLENYTLNVGGPVANIVSYSVWGALRGLETFSQIVYKSTMNVGQLVVNKTTITDYPRFRHRGFLVDTSRHFVSMKVLMQFLDAMAYNKFNVLHWHIVDDQSFPYESTTYPFMSKQGAYTPTSVYSQKNVSAIIDYARDRGIRVLPEFDTPGHTKSWGSVKDLLTPCEDTSGNAIGTYGPINPILNTTYSFLKPFFQEIKKVFPDKYVHLGGDEVSFKCWQSNKDIQAFMAQMGFGSDYAKLEGYYEKKFLDIIEGIEIQPIVWQEVIDNGVQVVPETVVHVWKNPWPSELYNVTKKGYISLLSTPWYLNYAQNPYSQDWKSIYTVEPLKFNGTATQKALVLGGEAAMWGEYVDSTNLIQRSWPRGSAVAERLWSSETVADVNKAAPRLAEQRCRMMRRGLQAEPVTGPGFCPL